MEKKEQAEERMTDIKTTRHHNMMLNDYMIIKTTDSHSTNQRTEQLETLTDQCTSQLKLTTCYELLFTLSVPNRETFGDAGPN